MTELGAGNGCMREKEEADEVREQFGVERAFDNLAVDHAAQRQPR